MTTTYELFAAAYGQSTYGGDVYNSTTSTGTSTDGGTLPATGTNMVLGLAGGVLLIVIAVVLFITARRKKNKK